MSFPTNLSTTVRSSAPRRRVGVPHAVALALTMALLFEPSIVRAAGNGRQAAPARAGAAGAITMYEGAYRMEMLPLTGKAPMASERAYVARLAAVAARYAVHYPTVAAARAAGFRTYGVLDVPGQGAHYFDPTAFITTSLGAFDINHPPFLVYHGTRLAGIMYYMPSGTSPAQLAQLAPRSLAPWHRHVDTCIVGGMEVGKVVAAYTLTSCAARGGRFYPHTGWMVHVWLGQPVGPSLLAMDQPGMPAGM